MHIALDVFELLIELNAIQKTLWYINIMESCEIE